jgi:hypothetical protein
MPDPVTITCPGCRKPLHIPADAVGKPAHCPHCKAPFRLQPDGSAGPIVRRSLPRPLVVPAFALIVLGLAGVLVNGYLSVLFALKAGADRDFARGRVAEVRSSQALSAGMKGGEWQYAPAAAVAGGAAAVAAEERDNEEVVETWAPGMKPLHLASTAVSAVAFLGGLSTLTGRFYPMAVLGCVAAILNVNHLCCLPGAVAGVWGLLALARDEVRPHFRRTMNTEPNTIKT